MHRSSTRRYSSVAAVGALAGLTVVLLLPGGPVDDLRDGSGADDTAVDTADRSGGPAVAVSATASNRAGSAGTAGAAAPAEPPTAAGLTAALRGPLSAAVLGPDVGVVVSDLTTGAVLLDDAGAAPRVPASTAKIVTAVSALHHLGADATLQTRTVRGESADDVVLVGGGDTTLTRRGGGRTYPPTASLAELANATAATLKSEGRTSVRLVLDDTAFSGPRTAPGWAPTDLTGGTVSPVSALTVDAGRLRPGERARATDPTAHAGSLFSQLLDRRGITVTGTARAAAPAGAVTLAVVESPRIDSLVERMLLDSDNDLAEALAQAAGIASGDGGSFAGGANAATAALEDLGVDPTGLTLVDASGLSRQDAVGADLLTALIVLAAHPDRGEFRSLLTGLPAAGVEGTLADRFDDRGTRRARGVVRAKTGTLIGIHALAGTVVDRAGRDLAFAVLADETSMDSLAVRDALDRVAAALAECGCR